MEQKKRPFVEAKQRKKHAETRLDSSRKALAAAKRNADNHVEQMRAAERSEEQLRVQKEEYEEALTQESQELQLSLNEAQVAEYETLARKAGKKCSSIQSELASLNQEQDLDRRQVGLLPLSVGVTSVRCASSSFFLSTIVVIENWETFFPKYSTNRRFCVIMG